MSERGIVVMIFFLQHINAVDLVTCSSATALSRLHELNESAEYDEIQMHMLHVVKSQIILKKNKKRKEVNIK